MEIEVTQADRKAAIDALNAAERQRSFGGNGTVLSQVCEIIARHRQAAIKERDAEIVAWLLGDSPEHPGDIADAIERGEV